MNIIFIMVYTLNEMVFKGQRINNLKTNLHRNQNEIERICSIWQQTDRVQCWTFNVDGVSHSKSNSNSHKSNICIPTKTMKQRYCITNISLISPSHCLTLPRMVTEYNRVQLSLNSICPNIHSLHPLIMSI